MNCRSGLWTMDPLKDPYKANLKQSGILIDYSTLRILSDFGGFHRFVQSITRDDYGLYLEVIIKNRYMRITSKRFIIIGLRILHWPNQYYQICITNSIVDFKSFLCFSNGVNLKKNYLWYMNPPARLWSPNSENPTEKITF